MSLLLFAPPPPPAEPLFSLSFACDPRGKGRGRATRTGPRCGTCRLPSGQLIVRSHEPTRALEGEIREHARELVFRQLGGKALSGPLLCLVVGRWPRIQQMPAKDYTGRQWRTSSPDFDNLAKLVTDALNGLVYTDDRQIVDGRAQTVFAAAHEVPGVELYLWAAPTFPPELERAHTPKECTK